MSKLEQLIQEYCPDGVEYVKLGKKTTIVRGASPRPINSYFTDDPEGVNWIKIGDVELNAKYITKTAQRITCDGAEKSRLLKKGDFILSNSMSFGRPYILAIDGCIHDGWIAISDFEQAFNADFLYYLLNSKTVQNYWEQAVPIGTIRNLNADIVRATPVPVPPLLVQLEIARILDQFMKLTSELTAELTARKKQYEYYRDFLLTFEKTGVFQNLKTILPLNAGGRLPPLRRKRRL